MMNFLDLMILVRMEIEIVEKRESRPSSGSGEKRRHDGNSSGLDVSPNNGRYIGVYTLW